MDKALPSFDVQDPYATCPHCHGHGRVPHECQQYDMLILETVYATILPGSSEALRIYFCRVCGQLWKVRWQYDAGTGSDNIWLRLGESNRGYEFTREEATKALRKAGYRVVRGKITWPEQDAP